MAGNRVVHFEIPANEPEKLAEFYCNLFGWVAKQQPKAPIEYWYCSMDRKLRASTAALRSASTRSILALITWMLRALKMPWTMR